MLNRFVRLIKANDLHLWVFSTGAIVLIIEVVAVRILAPHFGNTLFSVSSVLSVVLLALSVGYWVGGNWSDKNPSRSLFYSIIAGSGGLVLFIELIRDPVLETIGRHFSLASGPLISATILFIGPAFMLGMLSPMAIKLKTVENKKLGIGRVTGGIFFWSTLGSISGSLGAGFVLIPRFGVDVIMLSIGIVLVLLGLVPLLLSKKISKQKSATLLVIVTTLFISILSARGVTASQIIYQEDGVYERITISEGTYFGRRVRSLVQDRSAAAAAYVDSDELVYDYTKYYSLYEVFGTSLEHALAIGGGAYSVPKALLNEPSQPTVDVVEIEPRLFDLAGQYFNLPDSPRLRNHVEDGRRFLKQSEQKYDLIFGDAYHSIFSIPSHLTTVEFYELAKSRLTDDGVFIANIIGDMYRTDDSFWLSQMRTFRQAFPNSHFFATRSPGLPATQNMVMVGAHGDVPSEIDFVALRDSNNSILAGLEQKQIDPKRFDLDRYLLITDNYAPIDFLVSKMLDRDRKSLPKEGNHALNIIEQLLGYGPRYVGSTGGDTAAAFIESEIRAHTNEVTVQEWKDNGVSYTNVIGSLMPDKAKRLILASHYDSKRFADQDPVSPQQPVPGANDSASGVATLLTVAMELGQQRFDWPYDFGIDFVFFDGEEGPPDGNWRSVGSEYFAANLDSLYHNGLPQGAVVVDMVCEHDAVFLPEKTSQLAAPELVASFWAAGNRVDPKAFRDQSGGPSIRDDHTPLTAAGIPSILVIDFEYESFHTTRDTVDKCSQQTMSTVIDTLQSFLASYGS